MSKVIIISIAAMIVILILTGGWFYWFQFRPSKIKRSCNSWAGNQSGYDNVKGMSSNIIDLKKQKYDAIYQTCIREKGL